MAQPKNTQKASVSVLGTQTKLNFTSEMKVSLLSTHKIYTQGKEKEKTPKKTPKQTKNQTNNPKQTNKQKSFTSFC